MIENNIKRIVLWGHKLHTHTHSYIHYGFIKAFEFLKYETLWLDDNDDINDINFENSLFITEGQVDNNIPLRDDCYYILHNCNIKKYMSIPKKNIILLKVYTIFKPTNSIEISGEKFSYYDDNWLIIPWATDLLPHEVQQNIDKLKNGEIIYKDPKNLYLIGMPLYPWDLALKFCNENGIKYYQCGGFSKNNVDPYVNMKLIQESYLAPAIQSKWQVDNHYIPCRIFKNISYGKMGMTNNKGVYELFNKQVLYDTDVEKLLQKAIIFEKNDNEYKNHLISLLMEDVRDNHTYLNRIKCIFFLFNNIQNS